jgi:2,4-dienoyl-CoA reductase-like NADH-dependent reductase (Old Yellow Enzyme family)/thioredoxin reductase
MEDRLNAKKLCKPGRIGPLNLKNRIVMPAMGTGFCGVWGEVNDTLIEWYARRAEGGVGLIIVEPAVANISIDGRRGATVTLRADDDCYIPGLTNLSESISEKGTGAGIQLTVGAGCQATGSPWLPGSGESGMRVSPSGVPPYYTTFESRALSTKEVERIVESYGEAAGRIKQAGFDLLEVHAHGGYLIAQFLSPYFNKRTDKYGGNFENRCRFLLDLINAARNTVGPDFAITVRYSIDEYIEGGIDVKTSQMIAQRLEEAGVDGINISAGVHGSTMPAVPPYYFPKGVLLPLAQAIKDAVNIPVVAVGRLNEVQLAEKVLKEGGADFIGLGRALIADPDWPQKVMQGNMKEIRTCLSCNECRQRLFAKNPVRCTVNPVAGREGKYNVLKKAELQKKIVVVGGGPAGMEAARIAALRGHQVILFERNDALGGAVNLASIPPHKEIFKSITDYYSNVLSTLGIDLRLGKQASAEAILNENPCDVIIATGGDALMPDITGIYKDIVKTAQEILACKKGIGNKVVIVGGGCIGCEVANFLARKKKRVTIVEMLDKIGHDMESWTLNALKSELIEGGVKIITSVKVDEITERGVTLVDRNGSKIGVDADTVVISLGIEPVDHLGTKLQGKVQNIFTIGDAKSPGTIREAISDGFNIAFNL